MSNLLQVLAVVGPASIILSFAATWGGMRQTVKSGVEATAAAIRALSERVAEERDENRRFREMVERRFDELEIGRLREQVRALERAVFEKE